MKKIVLRPLGIAAILLLCAVFSQGQTIFTDTCSLSKKTIIWCFTDKKIKRGDGIIYKVYSKFTLIDDDMLKVIHYEVENKIGGIDLIFTKAINEWTAIVPANSEEFYPIISYNSKTVCK